MSKKKKEKNTAKKLVLPLILIIAVTTVALLSYFGVIELPFLKNENPSQTESTVSDTSSEIQKTTKPQENTTVSETEKVTEETTESTTEESTREASTEEVKPDVTDSEKESLRKTLSYIGSMYDFDSFSSSQNNAYEKILRGVISPSGVSYIYNLYYGRTAEYFETEKDSFADEDPGKRDPLDKFGTYYRYGRVNADNVDSIIKDVFGVNPDRSKAEIKENGVTVIYYTDGFYYFACEEGGSVGVTAKILSLDKNSDETFTAVYELRYDDDESTFIGKRTAQCKKSGSQWKIMSFNNA